MHKHKIKLNIDEAYKESEDEIIHIFHPIELEIQTGKGRKTVTLDELITHYIKTTQ